MVSIAYLYGRSRNVSIIHIIGDEHLYPTHLTISTKKKSHVKNARTEAISSIMAKLEKTNNIHLNCNFCLQSEAGKCLSF